MNSLFRNHAGYVTALTVAAAVSLTLAGCATAPTSPDGAAAVRAKLTRLQADPDLANRAPVALQEADTAVRAAEAPETKDAALGAHLVYMADRKVEIAMAQAATSQAEDQRVKLAEERERSRLEARTREADKAHADANAARAGRPMRLGWQVPMPMQHALRQRRRRCRPKTCSVRSMHCRPRRRSAASC